MSYTDDHIALLALHLTTGIGSVLTRALVSYLGSPSAVFSADKRQLMALPGFSDYRCQQVLKGTNLKKAEKILTKLQSSSVGISSYLDKQYPQRLKNHMDSPLFLFHRLSVDLNQLKTVGIVGTRMPTEYGRMMCQSLVRDLKPYGPLIVSGLAYGIDGAAHNAAVQNNLPTVAVLGSGIDRLYPEDHVPLVEKMLENGGVLSEFLPGTAPDRENFPRRNRIIAALSDVLIVVQSAAKGGSMITAEYANNYSKDVFAVPGKLTDEMSKGCHLLIKSHKAHLLESVKDIAYIMRWDKKYVQSALAFENTLSEMEKKVLNTIRQQPDCGVDRLVLELGLPLPQTAAILLNLEIRGLINSLPGKKYILAQNL